MAPAGLELRPLARLFEAELEKWLDLNWLSWRWIKSGSAEDHHDLNSEWDQVQKNFLARPFDVGKQINVAALILLVMDMFTGKHT